jgi:catechol 2,3-dioxygenase-like lactoylglutathione lyase family enzyme
LRHATPPAAKCAYFVFDEKRNLKTIQLISGKSNIAFGPAKAEILRSPRGCAIDQYHFLNYIFLTMMKIHLPLYFIIFCLLTACEPSAEENTQQQEMATADTSSTEAPLHPGHIVMQVSDLDRSQQFYENYLGLETKEEVIYQGERRIFMSASDSHHELVLLEARKEEFLPIEIRQLQQVAFEVSSHEALLGFFEEVKASEIPYTIKDNQVSLSLYFPDPDSVTVELYWDIQHEPFGESQWNGQQVDISEEALRNPEEMLTD